MFLILLLYIYYYNNTIKLNRKYIEVMSFNYPYSKFNQKLECETKFAIVKNKLNVNLQK